MVRPFVAIAIITNSQFEYLLIRRAREPYAGCWSLISGIGASQKGLEPYEAVIDEVAYDIGTIFVGELKFSYQLRGVDYADMAYVFKGIVDQDQIQANCESVIELRWFTYAELKQLPEIAFGNSWLIEAHHANLNSQNN